MGEHADDGDREDEESPVQPADDSPATNDEHVESNDAPTDDGADESADESTAESAGDSTTDNSNPDDPVSSESADSVPEEDGEDDEPGMHQYDTHDSVPRAEEWLDEHGDEDEASNTTGDDVAESEAPAGQADDEDDESGDVETTVSFDATDEDEYPDRPDDEDAVTDDDARVYTETSPMVSTHDSGSAGAGKGQATSAGGGGESATSKAASKAASAVPDFHGEMAPGDQEQPLTEHIEEMTRRFLVVALVMGLVASVALLWSDDMINFLWYSFLGPDNGTCPGPQCPIQWRPRVYHPLSLVIARLKMGALVGFVAGLPVAVYQTYRFMRPGLYSHERRYYLAAVPTSLVLAVAGVAFAYFIVLPSLFIYFSAYSMQAAELAFALSDTFTLMVMMLGFFAVVFQIPLLVMLAIMMGVVTRNWLEDRRLYFWTGFAGVAFFFSPDPTGMAPLIVAITMIALFEGTLLLLRWTERSVALFSAETMEENRPYAWALAAFAGYVASAAPVPEGYFDALPQVVVDTLEASGYVAFTPAIIAAAIVLLFEILGWIARRIGAGQGARQGLQVRLAFIRARPFVWLLAVVVGYMGSPDPVLLDVFRQVTFSPLPAVAVVVGLIVLWEAVRLVLSYVRPN